MNEAAALSISIYLVEYISFAFECRGRVADIGYAICARKSKDPSTGKVSTPNFGCRPYRLMLDDFERFHTLCVKLGIREDSRIFLADVEKCTSGYGIKIGLCLWDVSDALRDWQSRYSLQQLSETEPTTVSPGRSSPLICFPEFAPRSEWQALRRTIVSRDSHRTAIEHFQTSHAGDTRISPLKNPQVQSQVITAASAASAYAALQSPRGLEAVTQNKKTHVAGVAATLGRGRDVASDPTIDRGDLSDSSQWMELSNADEAVLATPRSSGPRSPSASPLPSLEMWLNKAMVDEDEEHSKAKCNERIKKELCFGDRSSGVEGVMRGRLSTEDCCGSDFTIKSSSPSVRRDTSTSEDFDDHPSSKRNEYRCGIVDQHQRKVSQAASNADDQSLNDYLPSSDTSVLEAILSPASMKPAHTQLLNAILRTEEQMAEGEDTYKSGSAPGSFHGNDVTTETDIDPSSSSSSARRSLKLTLAGLSREGYTNPPARLDGSKRPADSLDRACDRLAADERKEKRRRGRWLLPILATGAVTIAMIVRAISGDRQVNGMTGNPRQQKRKVYVGSDEEEQEEEPVTASSSSRHVHWSSHQANSVRRHQGRW